MNKFDLLKCSNIYKDYKMYGNVNGVDFDNIVLSIFELKKKERIDGTGYKLLRRVLDMVDLDVGVIYDHLKLLHFLNFINMDNKTINDSINLIGNLQDIIYMIDNKIDGNQLLRLDKIKKLKKNIK